MSERAERSLAAVVKVTGSTVIAEALGDYAMTVAGGEEHRLLAHARGQRVADGPLHVCDEFVVAAEGSREVVDPPRRG